VFPDTEPRGSDPLASTEHLTPAELERRGWTCFAPPCPIERLPSSERGLSDGSNPPGPPPDDRPATFTFLVVDGSGRFVGTELLIRTEVYKDQRCESTSEPYVFVPVIGYYECVHTAGR
jgi:hypothetical protein